MPLPLMPGDEPIEVKFKPQEVYVTPPRPTQPVRGDAPGCTCSYCTDIRTARQSLGTGPTASRSPPDSIHLQLGLRPSPDGRLLLIT